MTTNSELYDTNCRAHAARKAAQLIKVHKDEMHEEFCSCLYWADQWVQSAR